jgi:hypothetical protein
MMSLSPFPEGVCGDAQHGETRAGTPNTENRTWRNRSRTKRVSVDNIYVCPHGSTMWQAASTPAPRPPTNTLITPQSVNAQPPLKNRYKSVCPITLKEKSTPHLFPKEFSACSPARPAQS